MFAKVFRTLFYGSMTGQADPQLVFICLLTHADADGHVELPPSAISAVCGLTPERVQAALAVLEAPDSASRTDAREGRRLEPTGPGRWQIVNHAKYRAMRDEDERRRQTREAVARHRESKRKPDVSHGKPQKAHTEAEAEAEADAEHTRPPDGGHAGGSPSANGKAEWIEGFEASFWPEYPRKVARKAALKAWVGIKPHSQDRLNEVCAGLDRWRDYWREHETPADKIPHASTWLNQERWESTG